MFKFKKNKLIVWFSAILISLLICSLVLIAFMINNYKEYKDGYEPEQIHLAIGDDISEIVIAWSTRLDPKESIVRFGVRDCEDTQMADGFRKVLDSNGVIQYIHFVTLKHLIPEKTYCYYVGSSKKWSKHFQFVSFPKHNNWSPSVAVFGDMGVENSRALNSLINGSVWGSFDAILHVGDIGYNLYAFNGLMGDKYMRNVEPFAARVPYMVVPGNHEYECYDDRCPSDFGASYETRFKMPHSEDNSHYTFSLGPALFVGISTEVYFEREMSDLGSAQIQYDWLQKVLSDANRPENRLRHPWIIVFGHRPIYCTTFSECYEGLSFAVKDGQEIDGSLYDIEDLLYSYGVDLAFWGHQHYYERSYPVYNQTAFVNSMYKNAFVNPRAPVHIISGVGGMHSGNEMFSPKPALWTAFRSSAYGYTRFMVINETHLYLEQIDVTQNDKVIDSIWIIQENHIPFPEKNRNLI